MSRKPLACLAAVMLTLVPGLAQAEDSLLQRPASCEPIMTVQLRGCSVQTVLRCLDPQGQPWRTEGHSETGEYEARIFTEDHVLAKSRSDQGYVFDYVAEQSSSTSPAETVKTGRGIERVKANLTFRGRKIFAMAYNEMTVDRPLVLNGRELIGIRVKGTLTLGPPLSAIPRDFMNYYDPETGALLPGEELLPGPDGKVSLDGQPASLAFPGDPGFDSDIPTIDCPNISLNLQDEKVDPT